MATLTDTGFPTLQTVVNAMQPDGKIAHVVNTLTKNLAILEDIPFIEGNLPTGHLVTNQSALPAPTWRKLNQGVAPTKGETLKYEESCGMLEAFSHVDVDLANLNGNAAAFRATQDSAFLEGFNQEAARAIFYESAATNAERIHGFEPRYHASTGYTSSSYVLPKGTLSGTNCESIYLINWDPGKVTGIFPKASQAGLAVHDMGIQRVLDASSNPFRAYVTHYQWKMGLAVMDYRYVVRLQWDPDDSTNFPDSGKSMYLGLQEMLDQVYNLLPSARFYMSRTSAKKLDAQLASNSQNFLQWVDLNGRRVRTFMGVPIRVTDALIGESAIS